VFSERDAILLETLAEQAALALENLEYYEILHSRVELANRNLREAYQALAEERAKLAAAIESNESALIICDELHRAVFINAATARVLKDAAPQIGESVPHVLEQCGLPEFARLFPGIHDSESGKVTGETVRLLERDAQQGPARNILSAQLTSLTGRENLPMGTMLVVTDVTAQRELEQMKDDFVSYVAHELLSPLSTINGYASLLRSPDMNFGPGERESMFAGIEYQCDRLNRMVWDLLDLSRMEPQPRIPLEFHEIDLVALGEQVIRNQVAALPDPPVHTLKLVAEEKPILAEVDPDRMEQILINLVSNAVKYSPDGGTVTLALAEHGQNGKREVTFQVTDSGIGMTPDQVSRLFQKYYRTPEAQSRGIKGTGLGLHLTKRLIEAHGGRIEVESERGRGTTVTVTLPAEPELEEDEAGWEE
jgi:two-component system phosphate regulon sensor histidine kinase PhoR